MRQKVRHYQVREEGIESMTLIAYEEWNPKPESVAKIDLVNQIIKEYQAQNYVLTLRQLYYQLVARGHIDNTERSYKNLGTLVTKGRMAGMISWRAVEDRLRTHHAPYIQEDDDELVDNLANFITFDRWDDQDNYLEVWVEKEALGNVIERACDPWQVRYMSCKGYMSASAAWRAGRRYRRQLRKGKQCHLIHLGDHDPSGIDMTRDNAERVDLFSESNFPGEVLVHRIALNMDQVEEFDPPPNPAKESDSRAAGYVAKYGDLSWELDALEPSFIEKIIKKEILDLIDDDRWVLVAQREEETKALLTRLSESWPELKETL